MHSFTRRRVSSKMRPLTPCVDFLEARQLLSTATTMGPVSLSASAHVAYPMFQFDPSVSNASPPSSAFTPSQIRTAYGFNNISFGAVQGNGAGETIAIVDAYSDPNIQADLNAFDAQFGLPSVTVTQVNENGGTSLPATDSTGGWELEESLDVEWAHAIAPGAQITLVAASSSNDNDLLAGVTYAASHANVVSMSWGGGEFSGETSYDSDFAHAGVVFTASSGDAGAPISWPAASPNVVSVGGTALSLGSGSVYAGESGWTGSGGGPSAYENRPAYQSGVVTQTTKRANPDVAYDASPNTGFAVYDSVAYQGTSYGWIQLGGTSAGAPQWAALVAIADQGRALSSQPALNSTSSQEALTTLYANANTADFHDVTTGSSTGSPSYSAGTGYDYVTGIGSPVANLVVQSLDGGSATPVTNDHLVLSGSTTETAGASFNITVVAQNSSNATDAGYLGTIHFSSSDVQAGLPANYTFTAADAGSHTFSITLKTAGGQSVSAVDTTNSSVAGTLAGITVSPATASQFILSGGSSTATAGTSQTITVTAKDAFGNTATGYAGTVQLTSSDTAAVLPAAYAFTTADKGVHTLTFTLETAGTQSITVSSTPTGITATQSGIAVTPAAPINLSVTPVSSTQIKLTWTSAAGDTGYLIERSSNGTTGWTQIGSTAAGVTSYQDSGLSAATAYYYRVRATGGSLNSAYSNVANATTAGSPTSPGVTDTIWANSYTPSENAYAAGSYDVGVKFTTNVAGTVTGARFYEQTWMYGYSHTGYLWSSTGTLLASATFNKETGSGWQQVNFSSPVAVSANTVYIVSFSTGGGYFGITTSFFNNSGVSNGPLQALANGASGADGVYGSGSSFPSTSGSGMNFWADVAFSPTASPSVTPQSQTQTFGLIAPGGPAASINAATAQIATTKAASTRSLSEYCLWPTRFE